MKLFLKSYLLYLRWDDHHEFIMNDISNHDMAHQLLLLLFFVCLDLINSSCTIMIILRPLINRQVYHHLHKNFRFL